LTSDVIDRQIGSFDPDKGVIALPQGQPNVLPSKAFPWDSTKEVFVLSSFHSLHSLVRVPRNHYFHKQDFR